jgi:serine phosphatase RsbU (regulator of sigma subunit)
MSRTDEMLRAVASSALDYGRALFTRPISLRDPKHCDVPELRGAQIAAVYYNLRVAGDFYEVWRVSRSRVLFGLLDLAGRREDTRDILVAVQRTLRNLGGRLFSRNDFNEAEAMSELCQEVNRTVLEVAGTVRSCPGFIGCYNEDLGTLCYANAGHIPGLLRDSFGISALPATGLPFGLFSHATQRASACALLPGAALLIVSRGIVEGECGGEEFGLERVRESLGGATVNTAQDLCLRVLQASQHFMRQSPTHNDITTLAVLRHL